MASGSVMAGPRAFTEAQCRTVILCSRTLWVELGWVVRPVTRMLYSVRRGTLYPVRGHVKAWKSSGSLGVHQSQGADRGADKTVRG